MTFKEFWQKCQQSGVAFRHESQATYYFNLWCDTQKQSGKGAMDESGFPAFITWMKKQ